LTGSADASFWANPIVRGSADRARSGRALCRHRHRPQQRCPGDRVRGKAITRPRRAARMLAVESDHPARGAGTIGFVTERSSGDGALGSPSGRKHLSGERPSGRSISSGSGELEGLGGVRPDLSRRLLDAGSSPAEQALGGVTVSSACGRNAELSGCRRSRPQVSAMGSFSRVAAARFNRGRVLAGGDLQALWTLATSGEAANSGSDAVRGFRGSKVFAADGNGLAPGDEQVRASAGRRDLPSLLRGPPGQTRRVAPGVRHRKLLPVLRTSGS
jgi:hypothetical protein